MDKKKATTNPKNKDNECFKNAITAALNFSKINNHPERISKLKPFIKNYNWKDIEFPSCSKDWKKFDQNNNTIALNILYVPYNTKPWPAKDMAVYVTFEGQKLRGQLFKRSKRGQGVV